MVLWKIVYFYIIIIYEFFVHKNPVKKEKKRKTWKELWKKSLEFLEINFCVCRKKEHLF